MYEHWQICIKNILDVNIHIYVHASKYIHMNMCSFTFLCASVFCLQIGRYFSNCSPWKLIEAWEKKKVFANWIANNWKKNCHHIFLYHALLLCKFYWSLRNPHRARPSTRSVTRTQLQLHLQPYVCAYLISAFFC